MAQQIEDAASGVPAHLAEGNRRTGRDRLHLFRIAEGSTAEVKAHLRVALAWGWLEVRDVQETMRLLDRELGLLWGLTH